MCICCAARECSYAIGISTAVKGHIAYLDDTDVVYPAGHMIVRLDTETRVQRLLQGALNSHNITAMATSSNRRFTAFAETLGDRPPLITVYEWPTKRRRKVINTIDIGSPAVYGMSFSGDGKYLLLVCGSPEWSLLCVHWEKGKVAAKISGLGSIVSTSFVCVCGLLRNRCMAPEIGLLL